MEVKQESTEIDLLKVFRVLWKRAWLILLCAILAAGLAFFGTLYFVTPKYQANVKMYVNNTSLNVGSVGISVGSLSAAQSLVNTYIEILKTRPVMEDVIERADVPYSYSSLVSRLQASSVNSTEIFKITITDTDPERAVKIANSIADILPDKIANIVEGSSVKVVEWADGTARLSSPNVFKNTVLGFFLGLILACGVVLLIFFNDPLIRSEEYIQQHYNIPLLAVIPNIRAEKDENPYYKRKHGYGLGESSQKKEATKGGEDK